jgi:hypothetical protein
MSCAKYLIALTFKHIYSLNLSNDLSKFADDIAIIAPVYDCEVQLGMKWKTWNYGQTNKIECL